MKETTYKTEESRQQADEPQAAVAVTKAEQQEENPEALP